MLLPVGIEILKQMLAGQILARLDDLGDTSILQAEPPLLAALPLEAEAQLSPVDGDVAIEQRGEAIGLVRLGIILVPDPDHRRLEQPDDGGQDLLARQALERHMLVDRLADHRQSRGEVKHMLIFGAVPHRAERLMIAILLPAFGIAPGGLDMAPRARADPNVAIGGRNG